MKIRRRQRQTVFHTGAFHSLRDFPKELFKEDKYGDSVWTIIVRRSKSDLKMLKEIPEHLITQKILDMKIFNEIDTQYIKDTIENQKSMHLPIIGRSSKEMIKIP